MNVSDIDRAVRAGRVRISDHAVEEAANDHLTLGDIYESIDSGEIIEGYPEDTPYPSCLVLGFAQRQPIHSVWAYNAENEWCVLITVYRPHPNLWDHWRIRRKRS